MTVRTGLLIVLLFLFGLFSAGGEKGDRWTVEPFSGPLSGKAVTVTRQIWAEGTLTPDTSEGPLRAETLFALRCLREEMRERGMRMPERPDRETACTAEFTLWETAAEQWLSENAWRFGFIVENEPGDGGGSIRLRYAGPVHAAAMHALEMDLQAYLRFLRQAGQAALLRNGRAAAWIVCVPEQDALTFTLPEGAAWEISGDGAGWVIFTVLSGS